MFLILIFLTTQTDLKTVSPNRFFFLFLFQKNSFKIILHNTVTVLCEKKIEHNQTSS